VCAAAGIASWFVVLVGLLRRYQGKVRRELLSLTVRGLGLILFGVGVFSGVRFASWLAQAR